MTLLAWTYLGALVVLLWLASERARRVIRSSSVRAGVHSVLTGAVLTSGALLALLTLID